MFDLNQSPNKKFSANDNLLPFASVRPFWQPQIAGRASRDPPFQDLRATAASILLKPTHVQHAKALDPKTPECSETTQHDMKRGSLGASVIKQFSLFHHTLPTLYNVDVL